MRTCMMLCPSVPPSFTTVPTPQAAQAKSGEALFKKISGACAPSLLKPFRRHMLDC